MCLYMYIKPLVNMPTPTLCRFVCSYWTALQLPSATQSTLVGAFVFKGKHCSHMHHKLGWRMHFTRTAILSYCLICLNNYTMLSIQLVWAGIPGVFHKK